LVHLSCFWLLGCGNIALSFSDNSVVSLKSSPWPKWTQLKTIFLKRIFFHYQTWFLLHWNMFFFRLFLANTWKRSGHRARLRKKGEFISPTGLVWGKSLTFCTCKRSCARANDGKIVRIMRPSHGKLKFANSSWQTSKSWQTRALTRQTRVKSQHAKFANLRNMADVVQWHSRRAAACVLVLLYVNRQRRNRKRWNIIKVWTKRYISRNLTLVTFNTLVQELPLQTIRPMNMDNCELRKWIEKLHVRLYVRHFVKCHANHVNRARVLIGWRSPTHVCKPFTHKIRVCQHKKSWWKSWREFTNAFADCFCAVHTHQLEFAHTSLPT